MKKRFLGFLLAALCMLLFGCQRKQSNIVQSNVVTRIDITCESAGEIIHRSYTTPDKMRLVLLYIRSVSSPFASLPEPEEPDLRKISITTVSANKTEKVYRQHGDRYFQGNAGGWQKIDPEKGGILWELIQSIPSDPEENTQ